MKTATAWTLIVGIGFLCFGAGCSTIADARNSKGIHSLGDAANTWVLDTSYGGLKIVSEKQNVTNRKRTR